MSHQILFIELLGGIGDVLVALPAIQSLAACHPDSTLTVLTFSPGDELLQSHPLVHQVISAAKGTARQTVEQVLSARRYDLIVTDTMYEGIAALVERRSERTVTDLWRNPPADELTSDRFLNILHQEQLITAEAIAEHHSPKLYLNSTEYPNLPQTDGPKICLYPDAGMAIKWWSPNRFVTLGQQLQQRYDAVIYVPEGDGDRSEAIASQIPNAQIWPHGPLRQFAGLLARMDITVAADTGPARISAALKVPTITLFGPSWQGRYGQPAPHVNLQAYADCPERRLNFTEQVCWYSGQCPFDMRTCTDTLTSEQVMAAAAPLLNKTSLRAYASLS